MAKFLFILTSNSAYVENKIMQRFTDAKFRRELTDVDDDDLAIMNDPDFPMEQAADLESSGTIVFVLSTFAHGRDVHVTDKAEAGLVVMQPLQNQVFRLGDQMWSNIAEDEFLEVIDEIYQQ